MPKNDPLEKTKINIILTAVRLFQEKGWDNVNIEDVVKEVGVTRGAFYYYFKSREDLIVAAINQIFFDNNPFTIASEETGLNALEKLYLVLKFNINMNLNNGDMTNEFLKAMDNPIIFKTEFFSQINTVAPCIEKLLIEGCEDGSIAVQYPKQAAQIIAMLFTLWLSPAVFQVPYSEFVDKISFLEQLIESMGVPIFNEDIKNMALEFYQNLESQKSLSH